MYVANRHSNDSSLVWVKGTTKKELQERNIKIYCIVNEGYDWLYQIERKYME